MARRREPYDRGGGGHDGGGSMRWLLTYADMITLLMAFFIMMYSMSVLNLSRFRQVAISIRSGFGGLAEGQGKSILGTNGQFSIKPSPVPGDTAGVPWQVVKNIQKLVKDKDLQNSVQLRADKRGLVVSVLTDKVLFEKGQAELSPAAQRLVCAIAGAIKSIPNAVRVEGHTCDLPIVSDKFPSNWELSATRATRVVRCMIEQTGISPGRLSAAGFADSKPLVPNDGEGDRALNRRVDIVVLNTGTS